MQTKQDLEDWYSKPDPWEYETTEDDLLRKQRILNACQGSFRRALDIGCGEGWITKDLPAQEIHGLELSDNASKRLPEGVQRVLAPVCKYDLIIATGVLYEQYDWQRVHRQILGSIAPGGTIITCHIKDWEKKLPLEEKLTHEFPYREYTQVLRVFK